MPVEQSAAEKHWPLATARTHLPLEQLDVVQSVAAEHVPPTGLAAHLPSTHFVEEQSNGACALQKPPMDDCWHWPPATGHSCVVQSAADWHLPWLNVDCRHLPSVQRCVEQSAAAEHEPPTRESAHRPSWPHEFVEQSEAAEQAAPTAAVAVHLLAVQ